jgi:hypothetical protein
MSGFVAFHSVEQKEFKRGRPVIDAAAVRDASVRYTSRRWVGERGERRLTSEDSTVLARST